MDKLDKTLKKAYLDFVPSQNEMSKVNKMAERFIKELAKKSAQKNLKIEFQFGGSYAKGTWVKNESDIDIFAVFDSDKEIKDLRKVVPKSFIPTFGTRKYFRGKVNGITIEIVPVLRFSDIKKVENSIDLSVLHANYVNAYLSEKQKKDVIILKVFCKANRCYGSETYMHGFSGYSLEILIIKFGSFRSLLEGINTWKHGIYIGQNKKSEGDFPIFIEDPTNPKRNICASVSDENLSKFIFAMKRFYLSPSSDFFIKRDIGEEVAKKAKFRGAKLFIFKTKIIEPKDMFLSKYVKNAAKLVEELKREDIELYAVDFDYSGEEAVLFMQIKGIPVTKTRKVNGPSVWVDSSILKEFLKAHSDVFVNGENVCYDKKYDLKDFNKFILIKIKEYMSPKSILKN